jgi:antirestriction protein ArdC
MKFDVHQNITQTIIDGIEAGTPAWLRPWKADHLEGRIMRPLRGNGEPYMGINTILLWCTALSSGYASPTWHTYKGAAALGGQVRKGEHGTMVVYADRIKRTETNARGEEVDTSIPFLKAYSVFNEDQIDGLTSRFNAAAAPVLTPVRRIAHADAFFAATGADTRSGGNRAYYTRKEDYIQLPPIETFDEPGSYYSTGLHELSHWARHESRLNVDYGQKRFGDQGYAQEELAAELSATFLAADLGLEAVPHPQHAAYIGGWLKGLKESSRGSSRQWLRRASGGRTTCTGYSRRRRVKPGWTEPDQLMSRFSGYGVAQRDMVISGWLFAWQLCMHL